MEEIELSLMNYAGYHPEVEIRPLLDQFESEHRCRVRVKMIQWETGREELIQFALYGTGPAVSEIGTTWCPSFIAMQALRPFTPSELAALGGEAGFFPSSWQSCKLLDDNRMWAIPWLASVRFLYYRKDMLQKAGVDEKTAFLSPAHLIETLKQLQSHGIQIPLTMTTPGLIHVSLHYMASFVWGMGGDFIARDGKSTLLKAPETRAGLRTFLELAQYLAPEARDLSEDQTQALFWQGQAAMMFGWQAPFMATLEKLAAPHVLANLGVAVSAGKPFVGGSNLVIWRHIAFSQEKLALDLVRFLTDNQVQRTYNPKIGLLPVRPVVVQAPPFSTDAFHEVLMQGLETGRSFPAITHWAIVEDRLMQLLGQLWKEVMANPNQDIDALIAAQVDPLARRLDLLLTPV